MSTPEIIVFDLDFTFWDCGGMWVDCTSPPFVKAECGTIRDQQDRVLKMYPDLVGILAEIESMDCLAGVASRTDQPAWAHELLSLMGYRDYFDHYQIFPGSKVTHFGNIQNESGIPFENMLFFDDGHRNIAEVGQLGVKCVHVNRGVDRALFEQGLRMFS